MQKMYLLPTPMAENAFDFFKGYSDYQQVLEEVEHFFVEEIRTARRFLRPAGMKKPIESLHFYEVNKKTRPDQINQYLKEVGGKSIGVMSEAGCPGVADPGALAVKIAHQKGIPVVPLIGPSSILLALMASGFNGQSFTFNGYLPIKEKARSEEIKRLEGRSMQFGQTQIFIETPYRNNHMLDSLIKSCHPETYVCAAVDLTSETEQIISKKVKDWKSVKVDIHKRPTIFLLHSEK